MMRDTPERPEGIEAGVAPPEIGGGGDIETIVAKTQKLLSNHGECKRISNAINAYGDGKARKGIVRTMAEHFGGKNESR